MCYLYCLILRPLARALQGPAEQSGASYVPPSQFDFISPATAEEDAFAAASRATSSGGAVPAVGGRPGGSAVLQFAGAPRV